jgi:Tol biopolymer transport system component
MRHIPFCTLAVVVAGCATDPPVAPLMGVIVASDSTAEASPANLYVIKPDGTGTCYLTSDDNWNRNAGWSYDGTKVVWDVRNSTGGIWTMDATGDNKTAITPLPSFAFGPAFSPDGTHIVYSDYGSDSDPASTPLIGAEVFVMNVDGTDPVQLTTTTVNGITIPGTVIRWSYRPAYSPDGTKIVYASTQSGRSQIWVMNADGTDQTELSFDTDPKGPDANFPSFSPDGKKIVFLCGFETQYGNICSMNADGTDRTQLTSNPDDGLQMSEPSSDEPAWSPDGKSILFDSTQVDPESGMPAARTWIMNANGTDQRVLLPHLYGEGRNPWIGNPVQPGGALFECNN